jgi:Zn-dependent M16 (insulinase) family peptidase
VSFVPIGDTGISHLRVIFRFKENQVSEEVCKALDLWACLMNKGLSTVNKSYKQFSKELSLHSTNFKVSVDHEPKNNDVLVVFSLAALHENLNKAAQLLGEVIG